MSKDILKLLIQHKLKFLHTTAHACMLWWVSSVVFCGSVFYAVWMNRDVIKNIPVMHWFFLIIFTFFSSIVAFGVCIIISTYRLEHDINEILRKIEITKQSLSEFKAVKVSLMLGTFSFIMVDIAWICLWIYMI